MPSLTEDRKKFAYWRSFDQREDAPEFREWIEREFPEGASELTDPVSRRQFLTVMGASMALAGLTGCRRPVEKIVPYVNAPEYEVLGKPEYYATSLSVGTGAVGVVVETHEGRPTKVEGNELHPASMGGTDIRTQAEILNLYDPDRANLITENGALRSWVDFVEYWRTLEPDYKKSGGEGLALLTEPFGSPTLARLKKEFQRVYPKAHFVSYDAVSQENRDAGLKEATGRPMQPVYELEKADVVLSLDMDFLQTEEDSARHARQFARGRRVMTPGDKMNRLYVVEAVHSVTGGMADNRLRLPASKIGAFTAALALELEKHGLTIAGSDALAAYASHDFDRHWIEALAKDLVAHRGRNLVLVGQRQPAGVHALAFAINSALGNLGRTVGYREYTEESRSDRKALAGLTEEMKKGSVSTLIMIGGDPVYNAPADLDFAGAMKFVSNTVHLTMSLGETSEASKWVITRTHAFEQWGDVRSSDGSLGVVQPLIDPLFGSKGDVELLGLIATSEDLRGYEHVRRTWMGKLVGDESIWQQVLHDGILVGSGAKTVRPRAVGPGVGALLKKEPFPIQSNNSGLELIFTASAKLLDGRSANNSWLQEAPDPVTKNAWTNAVLVSPVTAKKLGVSSGDGLTISLGDVSVESPVSVLPGMADGTLALELGYGRKGVGKVADGVGSNVYPLRTLSGMDLAFGAKAAPSGKKTKLANTQDHSAMEGRPLIREATLKTYNEHPKFAQEMVHVPDLQSLWKDHTWSEGYQWGLVIDLNVCTGCNACVVACQSENNVPVVGEKQVSEGREMHWLRMDRYFVGDMDEARMVNQPVMCQHCEMAPCEQVCPVNATVHDQEGLNLMTYNRCIGTRYCSNNCPYKVRRFNFFNYTNHFDELIKMAQNPDVTVRARGVMEKCSYCLQRINRAKFNAKQEGREVRDGEIKTACQQACPSEAITFGNINDKQSKVAKLKANDRNYGMLSEFNTRPRTTYMARLLNPNPELPAPAIEVEYEPHGGGNGHGAEHG